MVRRYLRAQTFGGHLMVLSGVRRQQRNVLAAWLNDRFGYTVELLPGQDRVPDVAFFRDASDLMRFLEGNGFYLEVPEDYYENPIQPDRGDGQWDD